MRIDSTSFSQISTDLSRISDKYQDSTRRFQQARRTARANNTYDAVCIWSTGARWDGVLCRPETVTNPLTRYLISASRRLEELGEISADMSGFVEKYIFKILGGNESFGFKKIVASAVARSISSLARIGPLNAFKIVGCGLFGLSLLTSAMAIAFNGGGLRQHQANRIGRPSKSRIIKHSMQKRTADWLKNHNRLARPTAAISRCGNRLNFASLDELVRTQKSHPPLVQGLLNASLLSFKVVNKLFVSWDKHLAYHCAKTLTPYVGSLIGTRLTLCLFSGVAASLTIALDPLNLSISLIGIAACGVAALLAAAALTIAKRQQHQNQVLGRVTPC